jgi:hypothetical protein
VKEIVNVRFRLTSITEAYLQYPFRSEISFSTFYSHIDPIFKKPQRYRDICDYCELGKILKKDLIEQALKHDFIASEELDLDDNEVIGLNNQRNELIDYDYDDQEIVAIQMENFFRMKLNAIENGQK